MKTKYPTEPRRWKEADATKNNQDEYLEWSLKRNSDGKIETVTFTCEGPEVSIPNRTRYMKLISHRLQYWEFLAKQNPSIVDTFYKKMNPDFANEITHKDLWRTIKGGERYNPQNKWNAITATNTGTIAHLVQPNNTLSAEVDIAAQGTVIRKDKDGKTITDKTKLINCSRYGQPARNSDPTIGDAINTLARKGTALSVANPVAIYMHHFNTGNFQLDVEGTGDNMVDVPAGTFRWQRGNIAKNMGLRLQVKIPDGVVGTGPDNKGVQLTVSDIVDTSNNNNILYGAQFADYITMTVKGVALSGGKPADPVACPCPPPKAGHGNALAAEVVDGEGAPRKVVHLGRY